MANLSMASGLSGMSRFLPLLVFLAPTVYLILAIPSWIFARKIAIAVTGDVDHEISKPTFGNEDLYATGLLVLGVYLFLTYLGGSVGWLYYLAVKQAGDSLLNGQEELSVYDVFEQVIPCAGGLYIAIFARRFGRRLSSKHVEVESGR